jgi:hypothetical protein
MDRLALDALLTDSVDNRIRIAKRTERGKKILLAVFEKETDINDLYNHLLSVGKDDPILPVSWEIENKRRAEAARQKRKEDKERKALDDKLWRYFGNRMANTPREELIQTYEKAMEEKRRKDARLALEIRLNSELEKYFNCIAASVKVDLQGVVDVSIMGFEARIRGVLLNQEHLTEVSKDEKDRIDILHFRFHAEKVAEFRAALGLDNIPPLDDDLDWSLLQQGREEAERDAKARDEANRQQGGASSTS